MQNLVLFMEKYDHKKIEKKWSKKWIDEAVFVPDLKAAENPYYALFMFPYPSAEGLHIGNFYAFTCVDVMAKYKKLKGFDVFEPVGWDAFGIHSENYAIKVGKHPAEQAKISEKNFYRQLKNIGNGFDWTRTVETYKPEYYKWTQWLFIQLFKAGLAYRKKAPVNFCPSCKTVLADEQVEEGKCERCNSVVEKRDLEQWFFRITKYADRLLSNLTQIDWSEKVKIAQKQWIRKSEGINLRFKVKDMEIYFEMFDSVPQTFMAQTFTVIAPEHPMVHELIKSTGHEKPVIEFIAKIKKKKATNKYDLEKKPEGIFTGRYLEYTPTGKLIPIWIASYAIYGYGTGVFNFSAHDERDFIFAKKYGIPLHPVMFPQDPAEAKKVKNLEYCYHHAENGVLQEPVEFKGRKWGEVRLGVIEFIGKKGYGEKSVHYHLRDWLISRQRYWGPPIPMINCEKCGWQPVPEKDLPVKLPTDVDFKPTGESPLVRSKKFHKVRCPKCHKPARRESDTMDTFVCSSWYYFRYTDSKNKKEFANKKEITKWLPVDLYVGGAEHAVLHLMYARFFTKVLKEYSYIKFDEPFLKLRNQGMILAEDGQKMSKSRGNVINPDDVVNEYGADTLRLYEMFMGPLEDTKPWSTESIRGMSRLVEKVWRLGTNSQFVILGLDPGIHKKIDGVDSRLRGNDGVDGVNILLHKTIKKVTEDIEAMRFNTAISALMVLLNKLSEVEEVSRVVWEKYLVLFSVFAPHVTEELWSRLGHKKSIFLEKWPSYDVKLVIDTEVSLVVQVNGKVRARLTVPADIKQEAAVALALADEQIKKYVTGAPKKVIFVPGKLLSLVV